MTAIECKLIREGGTFVTLGTTEYHFIPQDDGAHVAHVADEEHVDLLLSIREGYRLYRGASKNAPVEAPAAPEAEPEQALTTLLATEPEAAPVVDEREALADQYESLYGERPHARTGVKKLRELIAAKQPV